MAGQFKTFDTNAINEKWHKTMSTVARENYPIQTMCPSDDAKADQVFYFTDSLANPNAANARVQGAAFPEANLTAPEKRSNHTQIFSKTAEVSGTLRASEVLGSSDEFIRQFDKISREVKRDVEAALIGGQGSVESNASVAGQLAGIEATIKDNAFHGAGGSTPGYANPVYGDVVAGTLRDLTEDMLNVAMHKAWKGGETPSTVLVGGDLMLKIAKFSGNAQMYQDASKKKVFNVVTTYVTPFGTVDIMPHYLASTSVVLGIDPSKYVISYLRKWEKTDLPKNVDSDRKAILAELTLKALDERSSFKIADVQ